MCGLEGGSLSNVVREGESGRCVVLGRGDGRCVVIPLGVVGIGCGVETTTYNLQQYL